MGGYSQEAARPVQHIIQSTGSSASDYTLEDSSMVLGQNRQEETGNGEESVNHAVHPKGKGQDKSQKDAAHEPKAGSKKSPESLMCSYTLLDFACTSSAKLQKASAKSTP